MMRMTRDKALGVAAALVLSAGACKQNEKHRPEPVPVRIQVVEAVSGTGGVRYSAQIRPDVQIDLAFKVSGYIDQILQVRGADGRMRNVQEGDYVDKGAVLAHVRDNEYRDRVAEAQAALTQARSEYERAAQMYENRTVSKADYDGAYARSTSNQARYNQAALGLEDCSLVAPMTGCVLKRNIEIGTLVAPGTLAFVEADTRSVKVVFGVQDKLIGTIHLGDVQTITTEAFPNETFRGSVTRIAPSADASSRAFEVECTIPNPKNALKSGMIAALQTPGRGAPAAGSLVPLNSIVRPKDDPEGYALFVVDEQGGDAIASLRTVKLGEVVGNSIVVTDGLRAGEKVVVTGATLVVDRQAVRIVP